MIIIIIIIVIIWGGFEVNWVGFFFMEHVANGEGKTVHGIGGVARGGAGASSMEMREKVEREEVSMEEDFICWG